MLLAAHNHTQVTNQYLYCHAVFPAGSDLRFSSTTSTEPPNPAAGFMNGYFDILMVLAGKDPEVCKQYLGLWLVVCGS
jgi:hypothetical protein